MMAKYKRCRYGPRLIGIVLVSKYMLKKHGELGAIVRTLARRLPTLEERREFIAKNLKVEPSIKPVGHSTNAIHNKTTAYHVSRTTNR